ncbi:class I SAM-dependent methyltransferase [Halalkalibacterium halodurans]|uniref:Ubiquinone biosynthesis methyltransferase UbiE n=1 Tax=Halalkalibacterium halodurans TaxID=86665 RepID=A0A0M0KJV9_ALKHA|nr:class I SAM-dependent methyltransferase [Halalkalibacterium halodurans]TES50254.1 class I SAM-dependent methyltransferase [Halalkalibacterium halodurans]TPE68145.1 class I SAM-dependent methyltransferase [Halalkalibacterium halodurans]
MRKMTGEEFDPLVSFFDGMAQASWLRPVHDRLKKGTGSWANRAVLDVGCGTGRLLARGVHEAAHLAGVDLSKQMVLATEERLHEHKQCGRLTVVQGDAYDLPFADESFDVCLSTCVMFLLPEPERGMKEMIRVLNGAGVIGMLNPTNKMNHAAAKAYCKKSGITGFEEKTLLQWSNVSTRRHRYTAEQLTHFFKKHGAWVVTHELVLDGLAVVTVASWNK